jgi:hypothetical protein
MVAATARTCCRSKASSGSGMSWCQRTPAASSARASSESLRVIRWPSAVQTPPASTLWLGSSSSGARSGSGGGSPIGLRGSKPSGARPAERRARMAARDVRPRSAAAEAGAEDAVMLASPRTLAGDGGAQGPTAPLRWLKSTTVRVQTIGRIGEEPMRSSTFLPNNHCLSSGSRTCRPEEI